jgi:hypothetical protein
MRLRHFWQTAAFLAWCTVGCEAHDYWVLPDVLTVDSEREKYSSQNQEEISQDLFVRYQLDYELNNLSSSQSTEVVVSATSYVNNIARVTGKKVWYLEPGATVQGILTPYQLQLGNKLVVSLDCCTNSSCTNREVICPTESEYKTLPEINEVASFCYNSCKNVDTCLSQCPTENACAAYCRYATDVEECRTQNCREPGTVRTCAFDCAGDSNCFAACEQAKECVDNCVSKRASCYKNCTATWNRCVDDIYQPDASVIPCALCGGTGKCSPNFEMSSLDELTLTSLDGEVYNCQMDCRYYPSVCISECESFYTDEKNILPCVEVCLDQHLFWCNDYIIPVDYVDSRSEQPCCFDNYCNNSLTGVVKSYDVECFNDTDCGSGKYCDDDGMCIGYLNTSSCNGQPAGRHTKESLVILLFLLIYIRRMRRNHV